MLLKQLCTTQAEELKALKEAFPAIFKEMSEIQETNYKQEKELDTVQTVITPLQAEIASLQERIASLTADLKQVHPPLSTFLAPEISFCYLFQVCTSKHLEIQYLH
jgi:chromosome segregation ATPase